MKTSFPLLTILFLLSAFSSEAISFEGIAIEDPSIQKHCSELTTERNKKISYRKKLEKVLRRNLSLQSKLEPKQVKVRNILQRLHDKLVFQIQVTRERIVDMGEVIIKGGCPPINIEGHNFKRFSTKEIVETNSKLLNVETADEMQLEDIENF